MSDSRQIAPGDVGRRRRLMTWVLVGRAAVLLVLGASLLTTGHGRPILGNLLATYWLIGSIATLLWAREHRGTKGSRLAFATGAIGAVASVLALARLMLLHVASTDTVLAILGVSAVLMGCLRLVGALHDDPRLVPPSWRRAALGLSEIALGVLWIASDSVTATVTDAAGLWGLLAGTILLLDGVHLLRTPVPAARP
jgi:uncharacterized membrane protein HdeD (DUF308 family)